MHASKWRLFLFLIGWESDMSFANHSQSEVKQNQSNCDITLDTQLENALLLEIKLY